MLSLLLLPWPVCPQYPGKEHEAPQTTKKHHETSFHDFKEAKLLGKTQKRAELNQHCPMVILLVSTSSLLTLKQCNVQNQALASLSCLVTHEKWPINKIRMPDQITLAT